MEILQKLLAIFIDVFIDGGGIMGILSLASIFGMVGLYRKAGIRWYMAILPWTRYYSLAKCAVKENEGKILSIAVLGANILDVLNILLMNTRTLEMLTFAGIEMNIFIIMILPLRIVIEVYKIRVYAGLCDVYGKNRRWMWLWIFAAVIPLVLWGWSSKFKPEFDYEDIRQDAVESYRGGSDTAVGNGLSVRLKYRVVRDLFDKKYLLRDINLDIKPGHMVLLLGGSGSGKTTLVNAINGYEPANAQVLLDGHNIYTEYRRMIYRTGYVPQQELMRPKDTVYSTLDDASLLRLPTDISTKDRRDRIEEVLNLFGLSKLRNSLVEVLSGGQKKRLSIAIEYLSNPSLFILDEPDSGLDGVMARELMVNLRKIADQGKIIIVITHTPDRVIDLFDDVIVLARDKNKCGRLAWFGSVEDARKFFGRDSMEKIVLSINNTDEGGEGRAMEFIDKFASYSKIMVEEVSE